jgi:hypothetical protein
MHVYRKTAGYYDKKEYSISLIAMDLVTYASMS